MTKRPIYETKESYIYETKYATREYAYGKRPVKETYKKDL